jgi:hypothetical protein
MAVFPRQETGDLWEVGGIVILNCKLLVVSCKLGFITIALLKSQLKLNQQSTVKISYPLTHKQKNKKQKTKNKKQLTTYNLQLTTFNLQQTSGRIQTTSLGRRFREELFTN